MHTAGIPLGIRSLAPSTGQHQFVFEQIELALVGPVVERRRQHIEDERGNGQPIRHPGPLVGKTADAIAVPITVGQQPQAQSLDDQHQDEQRGITPVRMDREQSGVLLVPHGDGRVAGCGVVTAHRRRRNESPTIVGRGVGGGAWAR